jgi:hypothetical protein
MADLPRAQSRDFGDFLKRETGEVMQIHDAQRLGLGLAQLFHEQPDFHDLFRALCAHLFGSVLIRGHGALETATLECQTVPGKVHQNQAHGTAGDGIEVAPAADVPAALMKMPEPDLINEFGR